MLTQDVTSNLTQGAAVREVWCVGDFDRDQLPVEVTHDAAPIRTRTLDAELFAGKLAALREPRNLVAVFLPSEHARGLAALLRADPRFGRTRIYVLPSGGDTAGAGLDETEFDTEYVLPTAQPSRDLWTQTIRAAGIAHGALGENPTTRYYFLDNKYHDVFVWFERTRWEWSEAPDMTAIDRSLLPPEYLQLVKHSAIAEFGTLPGAHNFLREWRDEVSFSNWALSWGAEEARHSLLLCQYLRAVGIEVMTKHALYKRKPYDEGPTPASTLMMNVISETRAAESYARLSEAAPEPVAAKMFQLLSRDEARHASAFAQFCKELCDLDGKYKMSAMEQAYYWLAHQKAGGFKHPAGEFYRHTQTAEGFSYGEHVFGRQTVDAGDSSVIKMIRKIVGDTSISSARDVKRWIRDRI